MPLEMPLRAVPDEHQAANGSDDKRDDRPDSAEPQQEKCDVDDGDQEGEQADAGPEKVADSVRSGLAGACPGPRRYGLEEGPDPVPPLSGRLTYGGQFDGTPPHLVLDRAVQ